MKNKLLIFLKCCVLYNKHSKQFLTSEVWGTKLLSSSAEKGRVCFWFCAPLFFSNLFDHGLSEFPHGQKEKWLIPWGLEVEQRGGERSPKMPSATHSPHPIPLMPFLGVECMNFWLFLKSLPILLNKGGLIWTVNINAQPLLSWLYMKRRLDITTSHHQDWRGSDQIPCQGRDLWATGWRHTFLLPPAIPPEIVWAQPRNTFASHKAHPYLNPCSHSDDAMWALGTQIHVTVLPDITFPGFSEALRFKKE